MNSDPRTPAQREQWRRTEQRLQDMRTWLADKQRADAEAEAERERELEQSRRDFIESCRKAPPDNVTQLERHR